MLDNPSIILSLQPPPFAMVLFFPEGMALARILPSHSTFQNKDRGSSISLYIERNFDGEEIGLCICSAFHWELFSYSLSTLGASLSFMCSIYLYIPICFSNPK